MDLCGRKWEVRIQIPQLDLQARFRQEDFRHRVTLILILLQADPLVLVSGGSEHQEEEEEEEW